MAFITVSTKRNWFLGHLDSSVFLVSEQPVQQHVTYSQLNTALFRKIPMALRAVMRYYCQIFQHIAAIGIGRSDSIETIHHFIIQSCTKTVILPLPKPSDPPGIYVSPSNKAFKYIPQSSSYNRDFSINI